jgi:hypothetical protein
MPYALNATFTIKPGAREVFTFTGPPELDDNFAADLYWGKPSPTKDLKLTAIRPDGHTLVSDNDPNAAERVEDYAPLPLGVWTVIVENEGSDRVRCTLQAGFGN